MPNKHINEFLDYYIKLTNPQYAVLLKGKWGSGKTHFINEYKKNSDENKQKYIYVSLYGVTSYDEIETKFLQAIHPRLYHKNTIFVGKIAKQLLKGTLKIDLDADGKADGNVSVQIPNFKPEDLLNTKDYILIFDDLERSGINIIDLLGYINFFVEHQSYKVILIANEEELEKTAQYKNIKEKLIGKTFEFKTNSDLAYDSFLSELKNETRVKEDVLEKEKSKILELFKKSKSNNLRILRQSLFDFERFYDEVLKKHKHKNELINDVLIILFIFIFETRNSKSDFFDRLENDERDYWDKIFEKELNSKEKIEPKTKNLYEEIYEKYNIFIERDTIFNIQIWKEIVLNSFIDTENINKYLLESKYYENEPSWKKLWNYLELDDTNFDIVFNDVFNKLNKCHYLDLFQIMLISSTVLKLKKLELVSYPLAKLFNVLKKQIDYVFSNDLIYKNYILYKESTLNSHSYSSLGFEINFKEYLEIRKYIKEKLTEKEEEFFRNAFYEIADSLKKDTSNLYKLLSHSNNMETLYYEKPVFSFIDVEKFASLLIKANSKAQYTFGSIINSRYENKIFAKKLMDEYSFILKLKEIVENEILIKKGKISGYRLERNLLGQLTKANEDLKNIIK
ncbi:hypothetical protein CRV00_01375 [Malaciobacter molluscorum]|uniref:P-loop NTPase fold protein n=1 Tax=Malaciobacter molluscorum TaxID=1032072 RepID=UPI00100B2AFE|nr:P-loop NTPase fold protein [Malaciobacter molluscorum]RXJ96299.1 hypothetical protein CRV00_01375 [Malaciobacter molluscorum]